MAEAEAPTYDFSEYDTLNAEKALDFLQGIDNWDEFVAFVDHEQSREKPRSTVLNGTIEVGEEELEVLAAYELGRKELDEDAAETQGDGQDPAPEVQDVPVVPDGQDTIPAHGAQIDVDLAKDVHPSAKADALQGDLSGVTADDIAPDFVSEEEEERRSEAQQDHDNRVKAYLKERRAYVLYGTDDQVADVDAELDRLGYDGDRDVTF